MVSRRQIKHAIKVLEQACDEDFAELKQEIKTSLALARSYISETDKKINALVHDQGKSQSVFGFTEKHIKYLSVTHSQAVKKFIENFNKRSLLVRMSLPHQGLFTHKKYFKMYGLFDEDNTFCMDYEHLLRSYKNFPRVYTSEVVAANWRADGLGNGRIEEIYKEWDKIKRDNKIANSLVLDCVNFWNLLKHYVKRITGSY